MAKVLSSEKSPFIASAVEIHSKNKVGQFSKYLQRNPVFVTYYAINQQLSRADTGTGSTNEQIGKSSSIRYNEIKEFPIYNMSELKPNVQNDDVSGMDIDMDLSGLVILPNTIVPTPDDFFYLKLPGMSVGALMRVTSFEFNTLQSNDFYTIEAELRATDNKKGFGETYAQLQRQVVERYQCVFDNIGTEDKCLVQDQELLNAKSVLTLINRLKDSYYDTYYDHEVGTFVYREYSDTFIPTYHYDMYLIKFLKDTRMYDDVTGDRNLVLNYDDVFPVNFADLYKKTLWFALENKTIDYLRPYSYYTETGVMKVTSPFKIADLDAHVTALNIPYSRVNPGASAILSGYMSEYFPIELNEALIEGKSYACTYMDEVICNFILSGSASIEVDKLMDENMAPSMRNYKYLPIMIYILQNAYDAIFASSSTESLR